MISTFSSHLLYRLAAIISFLLFQGISVSIGLAFASLRTLLLNTGDDERTSPRLQVPTAEVAVDSIFTTWHHFILIYIRCNQRLPIAIATLSLSLSSSSFLALLCIDKS